MPYLTPPPTNRKTRGVFSKYKRPTYYEDLYGEINQDEAFDRYPDRCESESDDDEDELAMSPPQSKMSGSRKRKRDVQDRGEEAALFVSDDEQERDSEDDEIQYKIAPRINPKQSIRLPSTPKMKPKKFGMFGRSIQTSKGKQTSTQQKELELLMPADDEDGPFETTEATERVQRIKRPASRQLIKQQLADRAKARKEALRVERAKEKAAKQEAAAKKREKREDEKYRVSWNEVRVTAKDSKHFEKEALSAVLAGSKADWSEYERFDE